MSSVIETHDLKKDYVRGEETVHALAGVSLSVDQGEFVAVSGPSGSGKSTLLYMIGCMDKPTSGQVRVLGNPVETLPDSKLSEIRQRHIGFVFQQFFLLPTLTASENVQLPTLFSGTKGDAAELLQAVGLSGRQTHLPREMSGGEMQRVAVARALVNEPSILLADEPTGNLDSKNSFAIFDLFRTLSRERGITIVVVTHNEELASLADRIIRMRDGKLVEEHAPAAASKEKNMTCNCDCPCCSSGQCTGPTCTCGCPCGK